MVAMRDPVKPTEKDAKLARESSRQLAAHVRHDLRVQIPRAGRAGKTVTLPAAAVRLLVEVLSEMAHGNAVTLVPVHAELTTQQAANILGVSRPFLVKQINEGKLPGRKVGSHRRVLFSDLLAYKNKMDEQRLATLAELAAHSQELNMGY